MISNAIKKLVHKKNSRNLLNNDDFVCIFKQLLKLNHFTQEFVEQE